MNATVGVLGGGQLGRMLALAGIPLGLRFCFLDPAPDAAASALGHHICAPYDDPAALDELARSSDVVTFEFENVPAAAVRRLAGAVRVAPPAVSLEAAQDRVTEKQALVDAGVPVAPFEPASSQGDLEMALDRVGYPAVVKTRRLGYDGKGQARVGSPAEAAGVFERMGSVALLVEAFVPFDRELSAIAVRSRTGDIACYPLVTNTHRDGILHTSVAPAPGVSPATEERARSFVSAIMAGTDHVGVLALEMFERGGTLLANEIAPRVHNSGHWTIEGAVCSQFENHLRAVLDLPLGATEPRGHCAMVNLIGAVPGLESLLALSSAQVHLYGKEPRPERKVGHVTVCAPTSGRRDDLLAAVLARLQGP